MALAKIQQIENLMSAISYNDMNGAKKVVLNICETSTNESHARFCDTVRKRIESQPTLAKLTRSQGLLYTEDVQNFDEGLFYVSPAEEELLDRLKTIESTSAKMQEVGIKYHNAALFFGPSGAGKTAFAKYVAKKMNREFYMVNLGAVIDSLMGGTAKNLLNIFDDINAIGGNCILFLDELDAISNNRDATLDRGGPDKEISRATTALMQQLDMLHPSTVLLAATNHIDSLDMAVRRRFPVQHKFHAFTTEERVAMVTKYLTTVAERASFGINWSQEELETFAHETKLARQSAIIEALVQCIADMIEDGREHLEFPKKETTMWNNIMRSPMHEG